ncbi:hypothetical protein GEMRC1_012098 [Eukaryota sp. GEM-RC1]
MCLYYLNIPTRVTMAVIMPVTTILTTSSLLGKIISSQIDYFKWMWMAVPAIPFAKLGVWVGKKTKAKNLRTATAYLFMGIALLMGVEVAYLIATGQID